MVYLAIEVVTRMARELGAGGQGRKRCFAGTSQPLRQRLTSVTCWPYQWPGNTHRVMVARPSVLDQ